MRATVHFHDDESDTALYLASLERDPEYLAARMRKLRREYGRVFAGGLAASVG